MQKTEAHNSTIQMVEKEISDIHFGRKEGPTTFQTTEIDELAETGEFYPIGGTLRTVGGRKPRQIGLAYSVNIGLVVAASQKEADMIAKELTPRPAASELQLV